MIVSNLNIVVFAYKRPDHLARCIESLKSNVIFKTANLIICVDGLKPDATDLEKKLHNETIATAHNENSFLSIKVIVNEKNLGLGRQYFSKLDLLLEKYEHLVVVEDDIIVGSHFLEYMTDAFSVFGDKPGISMIVGYSYHIWWFKKKNSCFFAKGSGNKAFGITRTFWNNVDKTCKGYEELKWNESMRKEYNRYNAKQARLLIDELDNKRNNSWDAIVYWNNFSKKLLSLYPDYTLAIDNGWNSVGASNTKGENLYDPKVFDRNYIIKIFPEQIEVDQNRQNQIFFHSAYITRAKFWQKKWTTRIKNLLKKNAGNN